MKGPIKEIWDFSGFALTLGPRPVTEATAIVQRLIDAILNKTPPEFWFDDDGKLMAKAGVDIFDLGLALQCKPDWQQIRLDPASFSKFLDFVADTSGFTKLKEQSGSSFPTPRYFQQREMTKYGDRSELTYVEQLAIHFYTTNFYMYINPPLRGDLQSLQDLSRNDQQAFAVRVSDILLTTAFSVHGVGRLPKTKKPTIEFNPSSQQMTVTLPKQIVLTKSQNHNVLFSYLYKDPFGEQKQGDMTITAAELSKKHPQEFNKLQAVLRATQTTPIDDKGLVDFIISLIGYHKEVTKRIENSKGFENKRQLESYYPNSKKPIISEPGIVSSSVYNSEDSKVNFVIPGQKDPNIVKFMENEEDVETVSPYSEFPDEAEVVGPPGNYLFYKGILYRDRAEFFCKPIKGLNNYPAHQYPYLYAASELRNIEKFLMSRHTQSSSPAYRGIIDQIRATYAALEQSAELSEPDIKATLQSLTTLKGNLNSLASEVPPIKKLGNKMNDLVNLFRCITGNGELTLVNWSLSRTLEYVSEKHLSKPGPSSARGSSRLFTTKNTRPDCQLDHAARMSSYIVRIVDFYGKYGSGHFKNFCLQMPADMIVKLQKAVMFLPSGMESEVTQSSDPQLYAEYQIQSAKYFMAFAREDVWPENEVKKFGAAIGNTNMALPERQFLRKIMQTADALELLRDSTISVDDYLGGLAQTMELKLDNSLWQAIKPLCEMAIDALEATGIKPSIQPSSTTGGLDKLPTLCNPNLLFPTKKKNQTRWVSTLKKKNQTGLVSTLFKEVDRTVLYYKK